VAGTSAALLAVSPASAADDVGYANITGSGTISPGLTTVSTTQSFTFSGTGALVDASSPTDSGVYGCTVSGSSNGGETVVSGQGTGSGSCDRTLPGPSHIVVSNLVYVRTGTVVTFTATLSGEVNGQASGTCAFVPTSGPPVTTYRVHCHITIGA
jgi:hypothetical protein